METMDILVVGAGFRGIAFAKTYHQIHPDVNLLIMDVAETVVGCWAEERIYPGLYANNPLGTYEFSDFPMTSEIAGCQPFEPIPGTGVHKYLCEAVKFFDLERYLRLGWRVQSAQLRNDESWEITYSSSTDSSVIKSLLTRKLVVATGISSEPFMPSIPGQGQFRGLLMHSMQLKARAQKLSLAKNAVVIGGNKSACDVSYQIAHNGGVVHMLLRPSGGGPSYQWPSLLSLFGRMRPVIALSATRFYTLFDPWPFTTHTSWIREFLHRWAPGRKITLTFWHRITAAYVQRLKDNKRTKMLVPWVSAYWMGTSLNSLNYPTDWYELVREGRIIIHHTDVISLSSTAVRTTSGLLEDVDAVVCCTGWKQNSLIKFLPVGLDLGLTALPLEAGDEQTMAQHARTSILKRRPFLASPPRDLRSNTQITKDLEVAPCRLYRYMIPPTKRFLQSRILAFNAVDNPSQFCGCRPAAGAVDHRISR